MIDWLTSKTALIIAAAVILAVLVGFFAYHQSTLNQESLSGLATDLAHYINDVSSRDSEIRMRVTFSNDVDSYEMPATVNGKTYTIQISSTQVILTQQGGDAAMRDLMNPVHIFPPPGLADLGPHVLNSADRLVRPLLIVSGQEFFIESRACVSSPSNYPTFCYISEGDEAQAYCDSVACEIEAFNTYDATDPGSLNDTYTITSEHNLTLGKDVVVSEGRFVAHARISHLWAPPSRFNVTRKQLNATDLAHERLDITAGKDLIIERRYLRFDDVLVRLNATASAPAEGAETFIYAG